MTVLLSSRAGPFHASPPLQERRAQIELEEARARRLVQPSSGSEEDDEKERDSVYVPIKQRRKEKVIPVPGMCLCVSIHALTVLCHFAVVPSRSAAPSLAPANDGRARRFQLGPRRVDQRWRRHGEAFQKGQRETGSRRDAATNPARETQRDDETRGRQESEMCLGKFAFRCRREWR